jgi:hypothetical protein
MTFFFVKLGTLYRYVDCLADRPNLVTQEIFNYVGQDRILNTFI